ncbi:hypothetical protein PXH69_24680 [Rhodococcus qingshengii]|uniref:ParB/Sulfiredoxin domain-containing protein n=1 Tax=Rhodococcus qingshengii TaxID=334542 RepID=A0AAW6LLU9_RHOSG|nr:hypothetical protein [Rhodococcus qingshengii]MDE8648168.1 hypothetical protein [Rhodococcus qingshengii]
MIRPSEVTVRALIDHSVDAEGKKWVDTFAELWSDPKSSKRIVALIHDMATRGPVIPLKVIPIGLQVSVGKGYVAVVHDGRHRLAAAYALMINAVPVTWVDEAGESV